jgi:hypothetical protein
MSQRFLPPVAATLLCWALVGAMALIAMSQVGWTFVYPLDDTYIHLSVARTLSTYGVWGVSPHEFASASSSPGWTLLLAGANRVFGQHVVAPLVINLLFAFLLLLAADSALRFFIPGIGVPARFFVLAGFVLITPLPNLVLIGMEHAGHMLGVFLLLSGAARILSRPRSQPAGRYELALLLGGTFLAAAMRYETVFAVVPVCILLLLRGRISLSMLVGLTAALAPVGFGLYCYRHSGFWLPFSVLMKAGVHTHGLDRIRQMPYTRWVYMVALVWLLRVRSRSFWHPGQLFILLAFLTLLGHMLFGPVGWLLRYESYAIGLALFSVLFAFADTPPLRAWPALFVRMSRAHQVVATCVLLFAANLAFAASVRAFNLGTLQTEQSCVDRFYEHVQMGRFVHSFYDHDIIAINDIGAVSYASDATLLDLAGLASAEPIRILRRGGALNPESIAGWADAQGAKIAILQNQWPYVQKMLPPSWTRVATWRFPRNVVFIDLEFAVYAIHPEEIPRLCASVASYTGPPEDKVVFAPHVCADLPSAQSSLASR